MANPTQNRLIHEQSPYLLQHAHNPVDWYPWGEEAFARARAEDRPIFLSVGYSTCHWCHVMARESFENATTAAVMNEHFVNIKVDREERPDVDQLYMAFVQATMGGGGWPMSVFLTPALKPFFGGTYFPPEDRHGRRGFPSLLNHVASLWKERRADLARAGEQVITALAHGVNNTAGDKGSGELLDRSLLGDGFAVFRDAFDTAAPGFGQAPKFPRPVVLNFLLRYFHRTGDDHAARMVLANLAAMARGGIHDQLGGGFHRYAVDRQWHVPHFEKMLYDQAQLGMSLCEAYQIAPLPEIERLARATLDYVLRDLCDPQTGAFYSAEDADSPLEPGSDEHGEGAFYVYTWAEIERVLTADQAAALSHHYGVLPAGNADDPHGELRSKNVLHRLRTVAETAAHLGKSPAEAATLLEEARALLLAHRNTRPRPHLDDKILSAWNGLMISALARAAQVLSEPRYLRAAERAATFFETRMWQREPGTLWRRYRNGAAGIAGFLDDYGMLALGLVDLYEASFEPRWLTLAATLAERMIVLFHDAGTGSFYATAGDDPSVLVRMRDDYDGAEPSGNATAALLLGRLGYLCDRPDFIAKAKGTVRFYGPRLKRNPQALPQMLVAFDFLWDAPLEVVLVGEPGAADTQALRRVVDRMFLPRRVLLGLSDNTRGALAERLPALRDMTTINGRAAAYVCRDWHCERPARSPEALVAQLRSRPLDLNDVRRWFAV